MRKEVRIPNRCEESSEQTSNARRKIASRASEGKGKKGKGEGGKRGRREKGKEGKGEGGKRESGKEKKKEKKTPQVKVEKSAILENRTITFSLFVVPYISHALTLSLTTLMPDKQKVQISRKRKGGRKEGRKDGGRV